MFQNLLHMRHSAKCFANIYFNVHEHEDINYLKNSISTLFYGSMVY